MPKILVRLVRGGLWLIVIISLLLASLITGLRLLLPHLNDYRQPIAQWVSQQADISLKLTHIEGRWQAAGPALTLTGITLSAPDQSQPLAKIGQVGFYFDIWHSALHLRPIFKQVTIRQVDLDLTKIKPSSSSSNGADVNVAQHLEQLFFTRLGQFKLLDSSVSFIAPSGNQQQLNIKQLDWANVEGRHLAQGSINFTNTDLGQLAVKADIYEQGGLNSLSGSVYIKGEHVSVTPWLNKQLAGVANITHSEIGVEAWLTLKQGQIESSKAKINNSIIDWQAGKQQHQINIKHGLVSLRPIRLADGSKTWRIDTEKFSIYTDDVEWPTFDIAGQLAFSDHDQLKQWKLALSNIALQRLLPLINFLPSTNHIVNAVQHLQPSGLLTQIRVAGEHNKVPRFSFKVQQLSVKPWQWVPGLNHLNATIAGDGQQGKITLNVAADSFAYERVFAKPLKINQAQIHAYWHRDAKSTTLWSDQLAVATPDLTFAGQARVDFANNAAPWLSLYGEANVVDAGQTWRYLPRPALGDALTDYLSRAIKGGQVKSARILWYGAVNNFPYHHHDGVFQAFVPLTKAKFSFDPSWPLLRDLQLDLLFENDKMYIDSNHVKTMAAQSSKVIGEADLTPNGHLKLAIDLAATGPQVRQYMLNSPLANSVGSALTTIDVAGPVTAKLNLDIPFNGTAVDASGRVYFKHNPITLTTPHLAIDNVSGSLRFTNSAIKAQGLTGLLYQQPIRFGFNGDNSHQAADYKVNVNIGGRWQLAKLRDYLPAVVLNNVSGSSDWRAQVGVNIKPKGVNYNVGVTIPLNDVSSKLPYPLQQPQDTAAALTVRVNGDKSRLYAQALLPDVSYQAQLSLLTKVPKITASNLSIGKKRLLTQPLQGQLVRINSRQFNADQWLAVVKQLTDKNAKLSSVTTANTAAFSLPLPTRVMANIGQLTLGGLNWHQVDTVATRGQGWSIKLASREANGYISWVKNRPLNVILKSLHLNLPQLNQQPPAALLTPILATKLPSTLVTANDRRIMAAIPKIDLSIADAWLQGYRLGAVTAKLTKTNNSLQLQQFNIKSGNVKLNASGDWSIGQRHNQTKLDVVISGSNSTDLLDRFGISGGVQNAPFNTHVIVNWQGTPWGIDRSTLNGTVATDIGKGLVSGVGGAGRLLGLFSLDSIIRKMKLDFSGVFDNGLAFNYIRGNGIIKDGIFDSDNIKMQALAGDMYINGKVNLIDEKVNANVKFIPDFTSGLPVMTAFAVAPQVALYVFAISTVLSPVLDVITQVNYQVTGPIASPKVVERSRLEGEYKIPESSNL
ncbi:membrane protein [Photobacterium kishitanii]|uniref:TIGR02099 family protein n=1 Tax=Photobacterium kishitanii TaxID=318456 RepID=A0AAX0YXY2_9GAMM|nr:YhdP family protein [Photobacterium kishitanii]KJG57701.1 membrane protein [Photobacterium kishitanii]KJG61317.1 membrane protein [Photobacterium kishitanii]KJG65601.1 membrane protein [Photobacterium kishitanii]KJG70438.1 membrane protein [Photobacterium kishitanii]PSX17972.1 TIGR02099 family protein [Photobacterium kishitanii]